MSHKHLSKIEKIFSHPLPANLDLKKTLAALEHYGVRIEVTKNHGAKLFYEDQEAVLQLPHGNQLSKEEAVKLRHILESFGLTPAELKERG